MKTQIFKLAAAALLLVGLESKAQVFSGGIIGGVSTSNANISNMNSAILQTAQGKNILGIEGGVYAKFTFAPFYLKPMALLSYQAGQFNFYGRDGSVSAATFRTGKAEVPVLLGLHILGPLNVEAGPVYNWVFMSDNNSGNAVNVQPSGWGYRLGANLDFGPVLIGVAYQGLHNPSSGSSYSSYELPNELLLNLGIRLGHRSSDKK